MSNEACVWLGEIVEICASTGCFFTGGNSSTPLKGYNKMPKRFIFNLVLLVGMFGVLTTEASFRQTQQVGSVSVSVGCYGNCETRFREMVQHCNRGIVVNRECRKRAEREREACRYQCIRPNPPQDQHPPHEGPLIARYFVEHPLPLPWQLY